MRFACSSIFLAAIAAFLAGVPSVPSGAMRLAQNAGDRPQQSEGANRTVQPAADTEAAENQPEMATGSDLKGPPERFRANETPE